LLEAHRAPPAAALFVCTLGIGIQEPASWAITFQKGFAKMGSPFERLSRVSKLARAAIAALLMITAAENLHAAIIDSGDLLTVSVSAQQCHPRTGTDRGHSAARY